MNEWIESNTQKYFKKGLSSYIMQKINEFLYFFLRANGISNRSAGVNECLLIALALKIDYTSGRAIRLQ